MQTITYGFYNSEFGQMVIGQSEKGMCWLGFMTDVGQGAYKGDGLSRMKEFYSGAEFIRDDKAVTQRAEEALQAWEAGEEANIVLDIDGAGTAFQRDVWKALLEIPKGETKTYGEVANDLGKPKAARAVGSAVGENPISLVVPCHRVLPKGGGVGNYGWGKQIKEKLLEAESKP